MRLYEIANEYQSLLDQIDICEDAEEMANLQVELLHLDPQGESAVVNLAGHIRNLEEEAEAIRRAVAEMEVRARRAEKNAEKWKKYILETSKIIKLKFPVKTPHYRISLRNNSPTPDYYDTEKLLFKYSKIKEEVVLDKDAIKRDLLSGQKVDGARLVQKQSLIIK